MLLKTSTLKYYLFITFTTNILTRYVCELKYKGDVVSGKLDGALEDEARKKLWDELKESHPL